MFEGQSEGFKQVARRKRRHAPKEADASSATCGRGARRKRKGLPPVADANLRWLRLSNDSDAKNQGSRKCPSHTHMTHLKGRFAKGWGHVRDKQCPSRLPHFFSSSPHVNVMGVNVTQDVRVTWGTLLIPHVLKCPVHNGLRALTWGCEGIISYSVFGIVSHSR